MSRADSKRVAALELGWILFRRDIRSQYRESFLGLLWAFAPAVAMGVGAAYAKRAGLINVAETSVPYAAYVIISMTLWQTFVDALNAPIKAVAEGKTILSRVALPAESLIYAKVGEVLFNLGPKLILITILLVSYAIMPSPSLAVFPFAVAFMIIAGVAVGLFLAPIGLMYQDITRSLTLGMGAWLLITPVLYPLPDSETTMATIVRMNPVSPLLVTARELLLGETLTMVPQFAVVSTAAVVLFVVGFKVYRVALPRAVERIGL